MKIAIIIPVFNRKDTTLACLQQLSVMDKAGKDMDIVLIDDGSTDGTTEAVHSQFPDTIVLQGDGNLWWTGAINKGVEYALAHNYDAVLLLNDDLKLADDLFVELFKVVDKSPSSLVSAIKLLEGNQASEKILTSGFYVSGKLQDISNPYLGQTYSPDALDPYISCDILTGATLFIPIEVFRKIGMFNEKKFPHNWGDFEFTRRANINGYKCLVATRAKIYTEHNQNYHRFYYLNATRTDYLRNLFEYRRYSYGFRFLFNRSFMHRPFWAANILYAKGLLKLAFLISQKVLLPNSTLRKIHGQ